MNATGLLNQVVNPIQFNTKPDFDGWNIEAPIKVLQAEDKKFSTTSDFFYRSSSTAGIKK